MYLNYSVVAFVLWLEAFGCVVLDQDEVTCLDGRYTWLLVVMFLDVAFSAVKKLLCNYLVDVLELLSWVVCCCHGNTFSWNVASC